MSLDVAGALEAGEDERVLESPDDVLHDLGLPRIPLASADDGVEDLDQVQDVLVDLASTRSAQVEEVEELELEGDSLPADHDVVVVDVSVVLAARMDGGDAACNRIEHVKRFEGGEGSMPLLDEKLAELLSFDQFTDDDGHLPLLDVGDLLVVVLHQDGAVPQRVELLGVSDCGLSGGIAVRVVELGGATDAGGALDNRINLAFPATSKRPFNFIFSRDLSPGCEVKGSYALARAVHAGIFPGHRWCRQTGAVTRRPVAQTEDFVRKAIPAAIEGGQGRKRWRFTGDDENNLDKRDTSDTVLSGLISLSGRTFMSQFKRTSVLYVAIAAFILVLSVASQRANACPPTPETDITVDGELPGGG